MAIPINVQDPEKLTRDFAQWWDNQKYGGPKQGTVWNPWNYMGPLYERPQQNYWDSPWRVARWRTAAQSLPPDAQRPAWASNELEAGYQLLKLRNHDMPWYMWQPLAYNDPGRDMLRSIPPPPDDLLIETEKEIYLRPQRGNQVQQIGGEATQPVSPYGIDPTQLTPEQWDQLPDWQRISYTIMSNPEVQGAMTMLPFALAGAASGAAAGAVVGGIGAAPGAVVGFMTPLIAGAYLGWMGDPQGAQEFVSRIAGEQAGQLTGKLGQGTLQVLNWPAEALENLVGLSFQMGGAYTDPEKYGELKEVLDNLPAAFQAGRIRYESLPAISYMGNVPAAIEWATDKLLRGETDVRFTGPGQAHILGLAEPQDVPEIGYVVGMANYRRELLSGADPEQTFYKYKAIYGFSGDLADLTLQMIFDPLNVTPWMQRKGIEAVGRRTGNQPLVMAARMARGEGYLGTMRVYGDLLRSGYGPDVAGMTPYQLKIAGLTPSGVIAELRPGTGVAAARGGRNVIQRALENPFTPTTWLSGIMELTPSSRGRSLLGMAHENAGVLLKMAGDNPSEMIELVRTWSKLPPADAKAVADMLGLPEAVTVRQALAGFETPLKELQGQWEAGSMRRTALLNLSDALGETPARTLEMLRDGGKDTEAVRQRFIEAVRERDAARAAAIEADPNFTANELAGMAAWFDEQPYHPEHFKAILHNTFLEHVSKWAVDAYGIAPDSKFFRFVSGLKAIQSLLLLGFNPAYVVNNKIGNTIHRTVDGVFGLVGESTINKFFDDFGIQPYRLRAGVGAADYGVDIDPRVGVGEKTRELYEQGGYERSTMMGIARAENAVRVAQRGGDFVQGFQDAAKKVSGYGPMSRVAQGMERKDSASAMYYGVRQAWSYLWNRKSGAISRMPPALVNELKRIDPRLIDAIEAAAERSMNQDQLGAILGGTIIQRSIDPYIPRVADNMGMPVGQLREMLRSSGVWDAVDAQLARGATVGDAFIEAERMIQAKIDEQLSRDIVTRAQDTEARVRSEGFPAAIDLFADIQMKQEQLWTTHFAEWERTFELAYAAGVDRSTRQALIRERMAIQDREWRAHQDWGKSTWAGVLRGLGFTAGEQLSPRAKRFAGGLIDIDRVWREFYDERTTIYRRFFDSLGDARDYDERQAAWYEVQKQLSELYDGAYIKEQKQVLANGADFVEMWTDRYGPKRAAGAAEWIRGMIELHNERHSMMDAFRAWERGEPYSEITHPEVLALVAGRDRRNRHNVWPEFVRDLYLPKIGEIVKHTMESSRRMWENTNDLPTAEAPTGGPGPDGGGPEGGEGGTPSLDISGLHDFVDQERERLAEQEQPVLTKKEKRRLQLQDLNESWHGPRDQLHVAYPSTPKEYWNHFSERIIATAAQLMRDELPPHDEAVFLVDPKAPQEAQYDTGEIFKMSANPPWYIDKYYEYKRSGKTLSHETVDNALDRIIKDKGADKLRMTSEGPEGTIMMVKDLVFDRINDLVEEGWFSEAEVDGPYHNVKEALDLGDLDGAANHLAWWLENSHYWGMISEREWVRILGQDGYERVFERYLEIGPSLYDGEDNTPLGDMTSLTDETRRDVEEVRKQVTQDERIRADQQENEDVIERHTENSSEDIEVEGPDDIPLDYDEIDRQADQFIDEAVRQIPDPEPPPGETRIEAPPVKLLPERTEPVQYRVENTEDAVKMLREVWGYDRERAELEAGLMMAAARTWSSRYGRPAFEFWARLRATWGDGPELAGRLSQMAPDRDHRRTGTYYRLHRSIRELRKAMGYGDHVVDGELWELSRQYLLTHPLGTQGDEHRVAVFEYLGAQVAVDFLEKYGHLFGDERGDYVEVLKWRNRDYLAQIAAKRLEEQNIQYWRSKWQRREGDLYTVYTYPGGWSITIDPEDGYRSVLHGPGRPPQTFDTFADAFGEAYRETANTQHEGPLWQRRAGARWYSQLTRTLEQLPQERMTVEQLRSAVNKGVKADELRWTFFNDWLDRHPPGSMVTKEDALEISLINQVEVSEVVGGRDEQKIRDIHERMRYINDEMVRLMADSDEYLNSGTVEHRMYNDYIEEYDAAREELLQDSNYYNVSTKFKSYSLEGPFKNYRELRLVLDSKSYKGGDTWKRVPFKPTYSHAFEEPNIIAWVRFNDRVDPVTRERILFIEEIQSDWHQRGREEGYMEGPVTELPAGWRIIKGPPTDETIEFLKTTNPELDISDYHYVIDPQGNRYGGVSKERAVENALIEISQGSAPGPEPAGPFSKTWSDLAIKRMMMWAAEEGYSKIAWTTGKQQADRYNLANYISRLSYEFSADGSVDITARDGGTIVYTNEHDSIEQLRPVIGQDMTNRIKADYEAAVAEHAKDLAEYTEIYNKLYKISDTIEDGEIVDISLPDLSEAEELALGTRANELDDKYGHSIRHPEFGERVIEGGDLVMGGEGMQVFYDRMLPKKFEQLGKRWGIKAEEGEIVISDDGRAQFYWLEHETEGGHIDTTGQYRYFQTAAEAERYRAEHPELTEYEIAASADADYWIVRMPDGSALEEWFTSEQAALDFMDSEGLGEGSWAVPEHVIEPDRVVAKVHEIQLPEAARQALIDDGMPLFQEEAMGYYQRLPDGNSLLGALKNADVTTWLHESAHYYFDYALNDEDLATVMAYAGVEDMTGDNYRTVQEAFADGYIQWRKNGEVRSPKIKQIFVAFRTWLNRIWSVLTARMGVAESWRPGDTRISPEMYDVYRRIFELDPWEMSLDEFITDIDTTPADARRVHREIVQSRIEANLPVDEQSLASYPDLHAMVRRKMEAGSPVDIGEAATAGDLPPSNTILPRKQQMETVSKWVSDLVYKLDLQDVIGEPESWAAVRNEPYKDLHIETHLSDSGKKLLHLLHYNEQGGDTWIDTEMIFMIWPDGTLHPYQYAYSDPWGRDVRLPARGHMNMFRLMAKNLLAQGFGAGEITTREVGGVDVTDVAPVEPPTRPASPNQQQEMFTGGEDLPVSGAALGGEVTPVEPGAEPPQPRLPGTEVTGPELSGAEKAPDQPDLGPMFDPARAVTRVSRENLLDHLVKRMLTSISSGETITNKAIEDLAREAGLNMADGANVNYLYDSLEGALNILVRDERSRMQADGVYRRNPGKLAARIRRLERFEAMLPKARRTLEKLELQQFSTPVTLSEAAQHAADIYPGDVIGEVTAGVANLVDGIHQLEDNIVRVNEIDAGRRAVLEQLGYEPTGENVLDLSWTMNTQTFKDREPYANVMIINPPWGSYSTGKYGTPVHIPVSLNDWSQRFAYQADRRLADGGRMVMVMPTNWVYTQERGSDVINVRRSPYLRWIEEHYQLLAVIEAPEGAYDQRATGVSSLLVVYDKLSPDSSRQPVEAWGDNRPESWREYGALVESIPRRIEEAVRNGQNNYWTRAASEQRPDRPATGPDATGLVDPAARAGDASGDPADIGRPAERPAAGRPRPGAGVEPGRGGPGGGAGAGPDTVRGAGGEPAGGDRPAGPGETGYARPMAPEGTEPETGMVSRPDEGLEGGAGPEAGAGERTRPARGDQPEFTELGARPRVDTAEFNVEQHRAESETIESLGSYIGYVPRSLELVKAEYGYSPHPSTVVETKALSGVPYPELLPEYMPSRRVMDAYRRGDLSAEGQLDAVWAAVQQADQNRMGIMIADDVGIGKSRTAAAFALDRIEKGKKRILVITKNMENVENLRDSEFPLVFGDYNVRHFTIQGVNNARSDAPVPTFDDPTIYFIPSTQFAVWQQKLSYLKPDVLIADEVHAFSNIDGADIGKQWKALHKSLLRDPDTDFMYLSATPGDDLADLEYMYGLKVWSLDGFGDWIGVITGEMSPEMLKKVNVARKQLSDWRQRIRELTRPVRDSWVQKAEAEKIIGRWGREGKLYEVVNNLYILTNYSTKPSTETVLQVNPDGGITAIRRYSSRDSDAGRDIFYDAAMFKKLHPGLDAGQVDGYSLVDMIDEAWTAFDKEYPRPDIDQDISKALLESGYTESSDAGKEIRKARKARTDTAYSTTVPVEHTEQIMRELKFGGSYMSRDISRLGVEYDIKQINLPAEDKARMDNRVSVYRDLVEAFQKVWNIRKNSPLAKAAAAYGINGDIQADAKRSIFDARLRGTLADIDQAIKDGNKVVVSLVSVSEVDPRESGHLNLALRKIKELALSERDPEAEAKVDMAALDEPLRMVARIAEQLEDLALPSPVKILQERYRGRVGFVIGDVSKKNRRKAMADFQNDRLDVIVISGAGKTGINLHDITGKRRVHMFMTDYEWSASTFKQEIGRVDRTGQKTSPAITIMNTGNAMELKFLQTIANRLKGLGATSKGGAESVSGGGFTEQFEFGGPTDLFANKMMWDVLDDSDRRLFLDSYFWQTTRDSQANIIRQYHEEIPATAQAIKKVNMGFQQMALDDANRISKILAEQRANLQEGMSEFRKERARLSTGKANREFDLRPNLKMYEVISDADNYRYGILVGVLTPWMNDIGKAIGGVDDRPGGANWREWMKFKDQESGDYISGLMVRQQALKRVLAAFGRAVRYTIESLPADLDAGERVPIIGADMSEWKLFKGQRGNREGYTIIEGAKLRNEKELLANGARYHATGLFWYVDDLDAFIKRFPIRQSTGEAPPDETVLFQTAPDGSLHPSEEAGQYAARSTPGSDFSVLWMPRELTVGPYTIRGLVFQGDRFVAYVPESFSTLRVIDTDGGKVRILGVDGESNWVIAKERNGWEPETVPVKDSEPEPREILANGTLDAVSGVEYDSQSLQDAVSTWLRPAMDSLKREMIDNPEFYTGDLGQAVNELSNQGKQQLKGWTNQVKQDMSKAKLAAIRYGERKRDFSLLNYSRRYGGDNYLSTVYPYQFFYTRQMVNWALRMADRPQLAARYARLLDFMNTYEDENRPSRLRSKVRIPAPYLPGWAGGGLWVDPFSKLMPVNEFIRPIDNFFEQRSRDQQAIENYVQEMVDSGKITSDEAQEAMKDKTSPIYKQVMALAAQENNTQDAMDFMNMFTSPAMYLTYPYAAMQGKLDQTQPLPLSRQIQAVSSLLDLPGLTGADLEAKLRKGKGLSEFGEWGNYYIDRQLANMTAEGLITTDQALQAMVERRGEHYELALKRVKTEMAVRQPGAATLMAAKEKDVAGVLGSILFGYLPSGLYPEGELELRNLKGVWEDARRKYNQGDGEAMQEFFANYPEYEARLALYDPPEERLKQFLISQVWDQFSALPDLHQKEARAQLGKVFNEQFLSRDTRDYDTINPQTLAMWSRALGGWAPGETSQLSMDFSGEQVTQLYQQYVDERAARWPNLYELQDRYFNGEQQLAPQLEPYWNWRDSVLSQHPELIALVTSEESSLSGVDPAISALVYQYRTARTQLFPDIFDKQNVYFDLVDSGKKKAYLNKHPELVDYWEWRRGVLAQHPEIIPYVNSVESVARSVLGDDYIEPSGRQQPELNPMSQQDVMRLIPPTLMSTMYGYYYAGDDLGPGSAAALQRLWVQLGKPAGSLAEWVDSDLKATFMQGPQGVPQNQQPYFQRP